MKAMRFHGDGELRLDDIPTPEPGPGDVLLAPHVVGICGTDAHIVAGHYPSKPPVVLGHEVSAVVVGVGKDVRSLVEGDLVTVEPHLYCRTCTYCRTGMEHMCPGKRAPGVHLDGGMAERLVVPEHIAYRLPDGTNAEHGALVEPLACCVHAMDRLEVRSGLPFVIFGCGPAGSLLIGLARLAGLGPIVAVDPKPSRQRLARTMGADVVLEPGPGLDEHIMELTGGIGAPYVVDAVGSGAVLENAIRVAGRSARILVFGVADAAATATVRPNEIYAKELTLLGTAINPFTHHRAMHLLHRLPLDAWNTVSFPLDRLDDALVAQAAGDADKVLLTPQIVGGRS